MIHLTFVASAVALAVIARMVAPQTVAAAHAPRGDDGRQIEFLCIDLHKIAGSRMMWVDHV